MHFETSTHRQPYQTTWNTENNSRPWAFQALYFITHPVYPFMQNNSPSRRRFAAIFYSIALCTVLCTGCASQLLRRTMFLTDETSGCVIKNPLAPIYTSVQYTGTCSGTTATGHGRAIFYSAEGIPAMEYEGMFVNGAIHGEGRALVYDGSFTIKGRWENGYPVECTASVNPPIETSPTVPDSLLQYPGSEAVIDLAKMQSYVVYPAEAKMREQSGKVIARAFVTKKGRISRARIIDCTDPVFIFSTLHAILQSDAVVQPAMIDGTPIDVWVTIPTIYKYGKR